MSLHDGRTANEEELRESARARLADHKVPERFVFLANLPKGVTGKIQRHALKETAPAVAQVRGRGFAIRRSAVPQLRRETCFRC